MTFSMIVSANYILITVEFKICRLMQKFNYLKIISMEKQRVKYTVAKD